MLSYIEIEQSADHLLVLGVVLLCLGLEEVHTGLAQPDRHLDLLFLEGQIFRRGEEISDNLHITNWPIAIECFLLHKYAYLSSSILHQRYG